MDAYNNYYAYPTENEQSVRTSMCFVEYGGCGLNKEMHCTCLREKEEIKCRGCLTTFIGRRRIQCGMHPSTIHLMDLVCCLKCGAAL